MPDLQDFGVDRASPGNINSPVHIIHGKVLDGGDVLADYTDENALAWPSVLSTLSADQQDEVAQTVAQMVIYMKAGIWGGG